VAGKPDPKPPRRRKDAAARKRAALASDECCACGRSDLELNQHHILYGADGRHDDPRNLVPVCGSGTTGCHGLAHAADPATLRKIGEAVASEPARIAYLKERLGDRALDYMRRRYGVALTEEVRPDPKGGKPK
jgi:hypothetical protein